MGEKVAGVHLTLHAVSSLDGYIASKDNTVSWLESDGNFYESGVSVSAEEAAAFVKSVDCYLLGSRTYEHAIELGWPYGDTPVVVLTSRHLVPAKPSVEFYSGDLQKLLEDELRPRFRSVWLVGGAELAQSFMRLNLVNEIRLTVAPVVLGDGLRLFGEQSEKRWKLKNVTAYRNGFVELAYADANSDGP